jgi:drug/metabolite transporter (DMT)-like permease
VSSSLRASSANARRTRSGAASSNSAISFSLVTAASVARFRAASTSSFVNANAPALEDVDVASSASSTASRRVARRGLARRHRALRRPLVHPSHRADADADVDVVVGAPRIARRRVSRRPARARTAGPRARGTTDSRASQRARATKATHRRLDRVVGVVVEVAVAMGSPGGRSAVVIACWYTANVGVLLLNKYILSVYGFRFPVFMTLCHMCMCSVLSAAAREFKIVPKQFIRTRRHYAKVAVLAVTFALSVLGGNVSLRYIPVSFNQALGATTPFFTAIFAYLLLRKKETTATYMTLIPVVGGIAVATWGEPSFNFIGFCACLVGVCCRALKSVLQGWLLTPAGEKEAEKMSNSNENKLDSMSLLYYMSPVAIVTLGICTFIMEPDAISAFYDAAEMNPPFIAILLGNCFVAYLVNLTNFLVTAHVGALSLQVLGNAKGVVCTIVSIMLFRNPVTFRSVAGYTITMVGVWLYSSSKRRSARLQVIENANKNLASKV